MNIRETKIYRIYKSVNTGKPAKKLKERNRERTVCAPPVLTEVELVENQLQFHNFKIREQLLIVLQKYENKEIKVNIFKDRVNNILNQKFFV